VRVADCEALCVKVPEALRVPLALRVCVCVCVGDRDVVIEGDSVWEGERDAVIERERDWVIV
jgi:hypothetical protein